MGNLTRGWLRVAGALLMLLLLLGGCGELVTSTMTATATSQVTTTVTTGTVTTTVVSFPPGDEMPFTTIITPDSVGGPYHDATPQIRVLGEYQADADLYDWIYDDETKFLQELDYSRYFAVMVFNGERRSLWKFLDIKRVWRDGSVVYVLAYIDDTKSGLAIIVSQYQGIKIDRSLLTLGVECSFILMDEQGQMRAETKASIS